ncbi:MAG: TrkH family potassium uptake protein, partial [Kiritimatiellia bacterium]|nr:TrkH family potassium uptake protein [Kiritimatiellia bacterium]
MHAKTVGYYLSRVLILIGILLIISLGVAWGYGDDEYSCRGLAWSAIIALAGSLILRVAIRPRIREVELGVRDAVAIVVFGWVIAASLGAIPYLMSGVIRRPIDAFFESMSGLTTTGASILTVVDGLPHGILFWRSLTHFLGGMGVLMLFLAILPNLPGGGVQLFRAEMTGPSKDRLTPRLAGTAKLLWSVYVGLIVLQTFLLRFGGLSWFDAACHSMATMATGGFSTHTASIGAFGSLYVEIVIIFFMILGATNFALLFRFAMGEPSRMFRSEEFRFFIGLWLVLCTATSLNLYYSNIYKSWGGAIRHGFFAMTSILTTTGFGTENFALWPMTSRVLLLMAMFVGGCAGSTAGAIKQFRLLVVLEEIRRQVRSFLYPSGVFAVKVDDKAISSDGV